MTWRWLNYLGKKNDRVLNEFVLNFFERNGSTVRSTTFYEKSTKLIQLNEKLAVDGHGLSERSRESGAFPNWYAVKKTIPSPAKVLAKSRKLPAYPLVSWALQQSVYRTPLPILDDLEERVRICWESLVQLLINKSISGVTDWMQSFQWTVDTLEFWISRSFLSRSVTCIVCVLNMRAVCYRVSCGVAVHWQKVNLTNNYLTFKNNISIFLC